MTAACRSNQIQAGAAVKAVRCPAPSCGAACALCGGVGYVPGFLARRYVWAAAQPNGLPKK